MKRRNLFGALVVLAVSAFTAQARTITLNGNVHDSNGNLVTGTHTVGVAIFSSQTGGTPVWTETHTGVSFSSGNFSITVGDQTIEARGGQIVTAPAGTPHKFVNAGTTNALHVDIHVTPRMETTWLET